MAGMNVKAMDAATITNAETKTDAEETSVVETDEVEETSVVETDVAVIAVVETVEMMETEVEIGPVPNARIQISHSAENATAVKPPNQVAAEETDAVAEETDVAE
ncbi:MAG: hypothetical protein NZ802_05710, partial [Candidatus Poseidoniales archaeon]|nr:hypothetical protein [Candidatus Poseidoniales archaeon]